MLSRNTLGVLAALLVGLVLLSWVTSRRYSPVEGGGFVDVLPAAVDPGSVQTIRAWLGSAPDSVVELTRRGEGWIVSSRWDWEAKADLVKRLVSVDEKVGKYSNKLVGVSHNRRNIRFECSLDLCSLFLQMRGHHD